MLFKKPCYIIYTGDDKMIIGIAGSRSITADIPDGLITENVTLIYSGGAAGADMSARRYATERHILITEVLPEYDLYGRAAPLRRNDWIIKLCDKIYVFWDGKSRGSNYVIKECRKQGKPYTVYLWKDGEFIKQEN